MADIKIINLPMFRKFDSPPGGDGKYWSMSPGIMDNGKIRFNINGPDNKYFGLSMGLPELHPISMLAEEIMVGVMAGDVPNVGYSQSFKYQNRETKVIFGVKDKVGFATFANPDHTVTFKWEPYSSPALKLNGGLVAEDLSGLVIFSAWLNGLYRTAGETLQHLIGKYDVKSFTRPDDKPSEPKEFAMDNDIPF